jgi:hypothetical protein
LKYYEPFMGKGNNLFNELILDALSYFPEDSSDFVINYISNDIELNNIDKTSGNEDKLQLVKNVIEKHAIKCNDDTFNSLVNKITMFKSTKAVDYYKQRIDFNHENKGVRVYWSFLGDLQFELLSILPENRLSLKTKELIKVLERKFGIINSRFRHQYGHGGWVSSPVSGKYLSTNNWISILTNKKIGNRKSSRWIDVPGGVIESSLEQFSRSFSDAVSKNPEKMINMALSLKQEINEIYIDSLFSGVANSEFLNDIPKYLIERMIFKYPCDFISQRADYLCRIIEKSDFTEWSFEVLEIIMDIAIKHKNPEGVKPNVKLKDDTNMNSYNMLINNAFNCVRVVRHRQ